MVFVVRTSLGGDDGSLWSFRRAIFAADGSMDLVPLSSTPEALLLVAATEFGDVPSYAALSRCSRPWYLQFAKLLHCLREQTWSTCNRSRNVCQFCWGVGFPHGFLVECGSCEYDTCQDCVVAGAFGVDRRRPSMWICVGCDYEPVAFDTVPSLRMWYLDYVEEKLEHVYSEYNFGFWLKLVALSGEEVRDEQGRPVCLVYTLWLDFARVWSRLRDATGWRICHAVVGQHALDETSFLHGRWSDWLERSEAEKCARESPFVVPVLLRGWH